MGRFLAGLAFGALLAGSAAWWLDRRARRRLGHFLAFAAHELNSPLTAANMMILNFRAGAFGELHDSQAKWLDLMREQALRLNGLVSELRDWVGLQFDGGLHAVPQALEVPAVVEAALLAIRCGAAHSKIEIQVELDPSLPKVRADSERLPRTLSGLLYHARKFRKGGGLRIKAGVHPAGRTLELRVEYAGPKLSASEVERSLGLFYPSDGGGHVLNAMGLGLGMARAVMRAQGGDLRFSVEPDGRSALVLEAPLAL